MLVNIYLDTYDSKSTHEGGVVVVVVVVVWKIAVNLRRYF